MNWNKINTIEPDSYPPIDTTVWGFELSYSNTPFECIWNGEYWEDLDFEEDSTFSQISEGVSNWIYPCPPKSMKLNHPHS